MTKKINILRKPYVVPLLYFEDIEEEQSILVGTGASNTEASSSDMPSDDDVSRGAKAGGVFSDDDNTPDFVFEIGE